MPQVKAFFTSPPPAPDRRENDPLGMTGLLGAAADVVLPYLSGRTRDADEYLWVLVGLRWSASGASSDGAIWERFERFEKALKLWWYHEGKAGFAGVDQVREIYESGELSLDFRLIANQRYQGLLGMYIRSLRRAGLVERGSLSPAEVDDDPVAGLPFNWCGVLSTAGALTRVFRGTNVAGAMHAKRMLGVRLFSNPAMKPTATAINSLGAVRQWRRAAHRLTGGTRTVAGAGDATCSMARRATRAIWALLRKEPLPAGPIVPASLTRSHAWLDECIRDRQLEQLGGAYRRFVRDANDKPQSALLELHRAVWESRGHEALWARWAHGKLHVRRSVSAASPPLDVDYDLRWENCRKLIQQTQWKPGGGAA